MDQNISLKQIFSKLMIEKVPSYANKLYYSLGFLSMTCFAILVATGAVMTAYGPNWWLTDSTGKYLRSVHLWATQGFVLFVLLHLIVVFLTSGYKKPRRLTWVLGALMFGFLLMEAEFGYVLRGDFSSQYRGLQGADFFNGSGLGGFLNEINVRQIFGIHVVVVPLIIVALLFMHYVLIRFRGIAKPYRQDMAAKTKTVKANHNVLFVRGFVLILIILGLAVVFPSPYLKPTTIKEVAQQDPSLISKTLLSEFINTSDTATYSDNLDPYTYNLRNVYVIQPYEKTVVTKHSTDQAAVFANEPAKIKAFQINQAQDYYDGKISKPQNNPVVSMIDAVTTMSQSGLYESYLVNANPSGDQTMYTLRFLADTGVMDDTAQQLGITTDQYGMLHEESSKYPVGAWWLAPLGVLDHTVLAHDDNGDRDGAIILGLAIMLLVLFPFIPILNSIPDKIKAYKIIWR